MDKDLKNNIIRVLEQCRGMQSFTFGGNSEDIKIADFLEEAGYLTERQARVFSTSLSGLEYLERLRSPRKAWLKKHWFAASIATITGVAALASVIVQILGLILD